MALDLNGTWKFDRNDGDFDKFLQDIGKYVLFTPHFLSTATTQSIFSPKWDFWKKSGNLKVNGIFNQ